MLAFIFIYLANLSYVSLLNIKTFKDTRSAVENALQHSHGNYVAHTILGKVLMKEGKFADAEAHFNKALAYDPNFVPTLVNLGSLYIRVGLFHEAITLYKQAITIESKTGDIANQAEDNYWTGFCFAQLNDLASAKEYYHKSIALNPEYPLAWNDLGNIDLAEGNYKAAQEKYTRAIRLDPNYAVAKHNLSLANRSGAVSDTKTDTRK